MLKSYISILFLASSITAMDHIDPITSSDINDSELKASPINQKLCTILIGLGSRYPLSYEPAKWPAGAQWNNQNEQEIVSASWAGEVCTQNINDGTVRHFVDANMNWAHNLKMSPVGPNVVISGKDADDKYKTYTVVVCNLLTGKQQKILTGLDVPQTIEWNHSGEQIAVGDHKGDVLIWGIHSQHPQRLTKYPGWVLSLDWSPDSTGLVSASNDNEMRISNVLSGESFELKGHTSYVTSVKYNFDGTRIISASSDKTVRIWDARSCNLLKVLNHENYVDSVKLSPNREDIFSVTDDGIVRVMNMESGIISAFKKFKHGVREIKVSPDGEQVAVAVGDHSINIWNVKSNISFDLVGHKEIIGSLDWRNDGKKLVSTGVENDIFIWHLDNLQKK